MSNFRWHCVAPETHPEHRIDGDGYYGLGGYVCTGEALPRDARFLLTFVRYGYTETLTFENEHDARMMLDWFEGSSASINESLTEVAALSGPQQETR